MVEMINIGFSSMIPKNRIIGIDDVSSSPIKRIIKKAKEEVKKIKKLEKAKKDAEFYRGMVESDVKAGRDPFNSRIKYEAAIKECERLK